ncbi:hypothetical protein F8G81_16460 [Arthrobacter sp. CDRTa11]|uniref:hypothetical protein n=1 Tax=Arthrobacter sp. CDRTa11 TaxID=2651199 RepID=UPI002265A861|nr:hypothetical protein [Arthrobacter sp. CDRTa11]UZX04016.1 hypothetical protein F8G81_16460 [Arthrobacter sp. CDRTa11]
MTYNLRDTEQGRKAETVQAGLRQQIDYIRADRTLTREGKRQQIAAVYLQSKREIDALKADEANKRANEIGSLRRTLFGSAGTSDAQTAISYRDAQERVGALGIEDEGKAAKLLDQAMLSGDDVLVKAVIQRALDVQWVNVANKYIDNHPYYGEKLEQLWYLDSASSEEVNAATFTNSLTFHIEKPSELGNTHMEAQIEAVANGAA